MADASKRRSERKARGSLKTRTNHRLNIFYILMMVEILSLCRSYWSYKSHCKRHSEDQVHLPEPPDSGTSTVGNVRGSFETWADSSNTGRNYILRCTVPVTLLSDGSWRRLSTKQISKPGGESLYSDCTTRHPTGEFVLLPMQLTRTMESTVRSEGGSVDFCFHYRH